MLLDIFGSCKDDCYNTMALAIITSSHLTRIGLHGSIVMWCTLIMRCHKAIIGRVIKLLTPVAIRLIVLSILQSIRMSMRSSIRCPMRSCIIRDMGNSLRRTVRRSRNRNMTSRDNRRYLTLRHDYASSSSMNMTSRNILA